MGHGHAPPADRAIILLGCAGSAITLAIVVIASAVSGSSVAWLVAGSVACGASAVAAVWTLILVKRDGFFHESDVGEGDEEDEDGNPGGGSGVRFPPDAPDGGGNLEFDWDSFLAGFKDYVDASSTPATPSRELEPALQ